MKKVILSLLLLLLIGCNQVDEDTVVGYKTLDSAINKTLKQKNAILIVSEIIENETFVFYEIKNEEALGIFTVYKQNNEFYINYGNGAYKSKLVWGEYDTKLNGRLTSVMGKVSDEGINKVKLMGNKSTLELDVINKYFITFNYNDTFHSIEYIK